MSADNPPAERAGATAQPPTAAEPTKGSRAQRRSARPKGAAPKADDAAPPPKATSEAPKRAKPEEAPEARRRPTLAPELARLLAIRDDVDERRPLFVRTASHRYARIGRRGSWRRPRGLQSKQRRHYGYRPVVVSIGFRSPKRTRGLTPTGFRPVVVRTPSEVEKLDASADAAVIARTVGVHRRLALEEAARKRGVHVLNPITAERREEA